MFNIISFLVNFLTGGKKSILIIAVLAIFSCFLYIELSLLNDKLIKAKIDLKSTLQANENLADSIEFLIQKQEAELKIINSINIENDILKEKINDTNNFINASAENNITKLFNAMVDRLWNENEINK